MSHTILPRAIFALTLSWNRIVGAVLTEGNDLKVVRKQCYTTEPRDNQFFKDGSKGIEDLRKEARKYCDDPSKYDIATYGPIEHWDVSRITEMNDLFGIAYNGAIKLCSPDISRWNVSAVTSFQRMFYKQPFNEDISCWDVSSSTTFVGMFEESDIFNVDIGDWDVSRGTHFDLMFWRTTFNQDIGNWDVSRGSNFAMMFSETPFNQDIGDWDMSNSFDLNGMFNKAGAFNQDISRWDVPNANYFISMFEGAESFNQPLLWDLSSGYYFSNMLKNATAFRQNMDHWLKWIDSDDIGSATGWCDGAVCDFKCDVFKSNKECKHEKDSCAWGKNKIFGECVPKKSKYKHDCTQYADELSCSADESHEGLCQFDDGACRHICDDLAKNLCIKIKNAHDNKKTCKATKVRNPCKKCHPKTTCG